MDEAAVTPVIGGEHHLAALDGGAEQPVPERHAEVAHELARLRVADPRVHAEAQRLRLAVHQVDHRAVRLEQARGLVDRVLKQTSRALIELVSRGGREIVEVARILGDHAGHRTAWYRATEEASDGDVAGAPTSLGRAAASA